MSTNSTTTKTSVKSKRSWLWRSLLFTCFTILAMITSSTVSLAQDMNSAATGTFGSLGTTTVNITTDIYREIADMVGQTDGGDPFGITSSAARRTGDVQFASHQSNSSNDLLVLGQDCCCPQWQAWALGFGLSGNVDGNATALAVDAEAGGVLFGLSRSVGYHSKVSLYGAFIKSDVDTAITNADVDDYHIGGYFEYDDGCHRFLTIASTGFEDYQTNRFDNAGVLQGRGNFNGNQYGVYLQYSRDLYHGRNMQVRPMVSAQYIHVYQDAFAEVGGANPIAVSDIETDSLRSHLGCRVRWRHYHWGCWLVMPEARAFWLHEYEDETTRATATFGGVGVITANGVDQGRDWFSGGVGVKLRRNDYFDVTLDYAILSNDRSEFHFGGVALNYRW